MNYRKVDPEKVAVDQLHSEAMRTEAAAYQAECDATEKKQLAKEFNDFETPAKEAAENAVKLRAEADAFARAGGITAEEIAGIHHDFLERWVTTIEQNHAGHAASMKVRLEAGLDDAGSERTISQLEISHEVAVGMLDGMGKTQKK